ncbi:MAG: class I SAM-dependent methyltransferase [Deltaproteobacteria bacterium]|nr:class I SAM-dependent methyltransferase [Deltaproteobacteria bacterium]
MKRLALLPVLFVAAAACGEAPTPPPVAPPTENNSAVATPPTAAPVEPAPAKPAEPTEEEKKKAEQQKQLAADFAKLEADNKTESARWTPALKAEAKALADKAYPNGKAAIAAAVAGKHRRPGHADRDKQRHPAETLAFFGLEPNMTVIEYGPGEGWYSEILAPVLAKKGKLIATNGDPNGPMTERSTYYAKRYKTFLDMAPEVYGKVETVTVDPKAPSLGADGSADMVILARGIHGMVNSGRLEDWLGAFHKVLKPGGILAVEQHRAKPDAKAEESAKKGYVPEAWVIEKAKAAGFDLAGKSEINANAKDTKDYPEGVWTLPPTLQLGDKDKDKYTAIGESDRMTLKFKKVAPKAAAPATPAKPGAAEATPAAPAKPATPATPAAPAKK